MKIHHILKHAFQATVVMLSMTGAAAAGTSIPLENFFRLPAASAPRLSPSGNQIALLVPTAEGRFALAIASTDKPTHFVGIAQFRDADVNRFGWINDSRLWFDAVDRQAALGDQMPGGLFAVDVDGSDFVKLISRKYERRGGTGEQNVLPGNRNLFLHAAGDGSEDVIIQRYEYVSEELPPDTKVMRLNSRNREARNITPASAPDGVQQWLLDRTMQPRVAIAGDRKTAVTIHWRDPAGDKWKKLGSFDSLVQDRASFMPLAVDAEGQLYVTAQDPAAAGGAATSALFRMAPQGKLPAEPLLSTPGYDFDGEPMFDHATGKTLGIQYRTDAKGTVWFDAGMRAAQEDVDKQLGATVNILSCTVCTTARNLVVTAYSDRQSPAYFLYDRNSRQLKLIAASRPWLDSARMAEQDFTFIKARDGQSFPVLVTRPQGKGPWPTVVLVHGGPYVRGEEWGFNPDTQFLASRGYLVIQPEFRGSQGYGDKLFRAGWKQWGLAMQDDITDATRWAINSGLADPKRIAIAGASYGGYATMMGLVKEPALYRAGINWVGVTDIGMMYEIGWSDFMGDKWMRYGMPKMIGDPDQDARQFVATSPLQQAAKIKQPVLMAYGELDFRVPLPHGTKMRDALKTAGNQQVEWIEYEGEGHGWMLLKNKVDFWTRVEKFLAKHLQ